MCRDLAAQGGDGDWVMPFGSYWQRLGACSRMADGVGETGYWLLQVAASCLRGEKGAAPEPGSPKG